MPIPPDYAERVYAGVLGKIIGVYLGRPFEGWRYDRITAELGEIWYYVHERLGKPLIVTDDDIAGTFTFLRALPDYGNSRDLTPAQIGQTWLNYLVERRTILWWGGLGNSTEHTAFMRLKSGLEAPQSGSIATNGKIIAEQIGAQIFIDGWAMVAPADPALAADLARRAASVSHDGEGIYGAQVIAAMEAQAFVEPRLDALLDTATSLIPRDSTIYRLIAELRERRAAEPDWRKTREWLEASYGYDKYTGNCHMVPNHGLIVLSLLYGDDDFQKTQMIVNTGGWDTDCNAGNVGCLMGIKNGLDGIDAGPDWRGPVADRLYLSTADGGRAISDAVAETYHIVSSGRALAGLEPLAPKNGARFHFSLPGSVQGFTPDDSAESRGTAYVSNAVGATGERWLMVWYEGVATGRPARVATPTFIPPAAIQMPGYVLMASPTLYSGQTVRASVAADAGNPGPVMCGLFLRAYGEGDKPTLLRAPAVSFAPGEQTTLTWEIPDTAGAPIYEIGLEITRHSRADGTVYLDYLTWDGEPNTSFRRVPGDGVMWRRAWIDGADQFEPRWREAFHPAQNQGTGLLITGTREWRDYEVLATLKRDLVTAAGLAARVQGLKRYYAILLCADDKVRLVKEMDGTKILAEADFVWAPDTLVDVSLEVTGRRVIGRIGEMVLMSAEDFDRPLTGGGIGLVCAEGSVATDEIKVRPADIW